MALGVEFAQEDDGQPIAVHAIVVGRNVRIDAPFASLRLAGGKRLGDSRVTRLFFRGFEKTESDQTLPAELIRSL
jgi:hypothetical protein